MNKTLLSLAIAATLAAPLSAQADDGKTVTLYGRINNAVKITDEGGVSTTNVFNVYSRIGVKAESDLGNGLTAIGRYEFSTFTETEGASGTGFLSGGGGIDDTRLGYVGLKGNFGQVQVGQTWSAFYNTVGTHIDPTYISAYYLYSSVVNGPYRVSNNIQYSNSFGPVNLYADFRLADSGDGLRGGDSNLNTEKLGGQDGFGIGVSVDVGPVNLAAAYDNEDGSASETDGVIGPVGPDTERTGVAARYTFGDYYAILGYQKVDQDTSDVDHTQFHIGGKFNEKFSGIIGYGEADFSNGQQPDQLSLELYYNMGGGFRLWYGYTDLQDSDIGDGDFTQSLLGVRFDF